MISNLPDISKAFGEEKTNEQILDSLQKYRKELNFLLMNLNESNMPAVANRLEGLDGSFSQISQDVDQISLTVYDPNTGIGQLNVRADSIEASVSTNEGNISSLTIDVNGISTLVYDPNTGLGAAWTEIDQNASAITLKASVGDVVNYLEVSQTGVSINANNIDLTGITTIYSSVDPTDKVTVSGGYAYFYLNGDNYLRLTAGLEGALITSPSERQIYFGDNVAVGGDISILYNLHAGSADFTDTPTVGSDVVVIADDAVYINTTTYGIDISAPGKTAITIAWGANLV